MAAQKAAIFLYLEPYEANDVCRIVFHRNNRMHW